MRNLWKLAALAIFSLGGINLMAQTNSISTTTTATTPPPPPVAKKSPKTTSIHGETLTDDYFWLRDTDKKNAEMLAHLEAENAFTETYMEPTRSFQETLYKEMVGRIKETDSKVPYKIGNYFYYSRTEQGKQYQIYARKKASLDAAEEITLDLNELAKGHKYTALGTYAVTDDGSLLAYSIDTNGFRDYILRIKDLRTGKLLADDLGKVATAFWANDNKTLFYVTEDAAKRDYRLYRHTPGEAKEKDALVYEEKDELYSIDAYRGRSRGYIFVVSGSSTTTEVSYIDANKPADAFKVMLARKENVEYYPEHHGEFFYIRINDTGRNFRLMTAPTATPQRNWREVIPARKDVTIEDVDAFATHLVVSERENGLQKLRITDLKDGKLHYLDFPEPVYSSGVGQNPEFNTSVLRYDYQSFTTPGSVYDYDMRTRKSELKKQTPVLGGFDPAQYQSERVYATAADGVRVPISLFYKKDLKRDGTRPLLLYGYGSYGISSNVTFNANRLSLIDRGVVYAVAHIRGGGDLGKEWHDDGKMMRKKNTFTDFITAGEYLVKEGYTSRDRLVATGGSAGGLLIGAVANMRPDLFKALVAQVPFVDVVNTMLDASLPLTVGEYLEWGNPNEKEAYAYIKSYSPYDNITAKEYPAMLVKASLNDSQVPYWEAAKYVAKLRAMKTDKNTLLLKTNMGAGHGGASGRYDALRDVAFDYAFILGQFGIAQ